MADLQYSVGVDTRGAQTALDGLQERVGRVTASFTKLQGILGGLALGSFIRSAYQFGDAISDLADATNISIQNIMGFTKAVEQNGGTMEQATSALNRFVNNIGAAAQGSGELQSAFASVGVSLQDLATLSEQDLLSKVLGGLNGVTDASTRTRLQIQLLGKGFAGVNAAGVANSMGSFSAASVSSAAAVASAAAAQDKLNLTIGALKVAVIQALEPINKFISSIDPKSITTFAESVVSLAKTLGTLVAVFAVTKGVSELLNVFSMLQRVMATGGSIATMATKMTAMGGAAGQAADGVRILSRWFTILGEFPSKWGSSGFWGFGGLSKALSSVLFGFTKLIPIIGWIVTGFELVRAAIKMAFNVDILDWFLEKLSTAYNYVAQFLGLPKWEFMTDEEKKKLESVEADTKKNAEAQRQVTDALMKQRAELRKIVDDYKEANAAAAERYQLETDLIGATTLEKDTRLSAYQAYVDYLKQFNTLQAKYNEASNDPQGVEIKKATAAAMNELTAAYQNNQGVMEGYIKVRDTAQRAEQVRLYGIGQEIDMQDKLLAIQQDIAKSGMSAIEAKYYDIAQAADVSARSAIRAEEARMGRPLNVEEAQKYYDVSRRGMGDLIDLTRRQYEGSRTFSSGWNRAFKQYADDATNAARTAERMFGKFTQGMEDLIVNFVKTGKFEWKDFVNTMAEELLRAQIQRTIANILGGFGSSKTNTGGNGGGGLIDSIKSLFGGLFANGGTLGAGKWGIAGEAGPEIITGPANIIPAGQLAGAGGASYVTYNINAVDAMSFKQLVAQDPQFIHAVAMQGARTVPSARR